MNDDPETKPGDEPDAISDVHPADKSLTETSSTRRTALGMTAAATGPFWPIGRSGDSRARLRPSGIQSRGKRQRETREVKDIAEVSPTTGKLLESQAPESVVNSSAASISPLTHGTMWNG
jgi:hypothetical protein